MEACRFHWDRKQRYRATLFVQIFFLLFFNSICNVDSSPTSNSTSTVDAQNLSTLLPTTLPSSKISTPVPKSKSLAFGKYTPQLLKDIDASWRGGKVCVPASGTTIVIGLRVHDLQPLQNCSIIEGNLVIKWMFSRVTEQNYTAVTMHQLVEVSGYIIMYRANGLSTLGTLFPNLRVIRGTEVFFSYALALYENDNLRSVSLPNLSYIGRNIAAMVNPELCYFENHVDWKRIIFSGDKPISINNRVYENGCALVDGCPDECPTNCWNRTTCQKECNCIRSSDDNHLPGCADDTGECCHRLCLGGCTTAGSPATCHACKLIYHDDQCMDRCPKFNENGEELLEFKGRRCVTKDGCIQEHIYNKFHEGKCIRRCPKYYTYNPQLFSDSPNHSAHECIPCGGLCEIGCIGGTIQTVDSAKRLMGCTKINNYLEIAISNIPGNMTLLYECLSLVREVEHYVKIVRNPFLETLDFLKSLRRIGGKKLDSNKYALYIMENQNLEKLWDFEQYVVSGNSSGNSTSPAMPVLQIDNGKFLFQQNGVLCQQKIKRLLELTEFKGELQHENGTFYNVTAESHTKYDISDSTNGQHGNCFNNSLFFEMNDGVTNVFPRFNFSAFNTSDERVIISYVLYFREVEDNEVATYYKSSLCNMDQKWSTYEVKKNDEDKQNVINNVTYYSSYLTNMNAFTRYALYVQTYTTKAIGTNGARSEIIYFKTKASKPTEPRRVVVNPIDWNGNTGLYVSWDPPDAHNGILDTYSVYYRKKPWDVDQIYQKDFCHEAPTLDKVTTPKPVETNTDSSDTGQCSCVDDSTKVPSASEEQEMAELRYNYENALQNAHFQKNPEKTISNRAKREIPDDSEYKFIVEQGNQSTSVSTLATPSSSTNDITMSPAAEEPPKPVIVVPSKSVVSANKTSVLLFNLEPNMAYSIEVVSCHAYDKEENATRCSKRAISNAITKPDPTLDVIVPGSLDVKTPKKDGVIYLDVTWRAPNKTNGPILSYTVIFWLVNDTKTAQLQQEPLEGDSVISECVNAKKFMDENNSYIYQNSALKEGETYNLKVKMRTVGTISGNYTKVFTFTYGEKPANSGYTYIIVTVLTIFITVVLIVGLVCWRVKRKKPVPLAAYHNSYNLDYMDTDNIYVPDEWEIERSKVTLGISLGQGSFGLVYEGEAKDLYNTDKKLRKVAIKTVTEPATIQDRINFLNEASRMKAFSCHHIVQLLGVVSQGQPVLVIMELMALGDLKNYLRMLRPDEPDNAGRRPPTLREILQMAAEIADGMAYLSDRKFVHRDLAARNCMVSHDMTVKIGDFGMTRDVYDSDYYRKGGKGMLPVRWMAPESLKDGLYTSKSDVWSYGVVLWEMATLAAQPYQGFSNEEVLKFVIDSNFMEMPDGCPRRLYEMMQVCWNYYPRYRPTFKEILISLQGDVKKSFFGVSWFYSQRDDEEVLDDESDNLNPSESQPLHPSSVHSLSDHHLAGGDHLHYLNRASANEKELGCDEPPPRPARFKSSSLASSAEFDMRRSEPMLNGHHTTTCSESEANSDESVRSDSLPSLPNCPTNPNYYSSSPFKTPSSIVSSVDGPPSYNTATILDQSILPTDPSIWSAENASKSNSCNGSANGSANGHLHFGTNTLTSAC